MTTPIQTTQQGVSNNVPIYEPAPLPPGWTEHRAPTGQFYYYHAVSRESTYVRPSITSSTNQPTSSSKQQDLSNNQSASSSIANGKNNDFSESKKKKKQKPKLKEQIPDTVWLKVTTTDGNVFYTNTETKTSIWTIPEEIKEQVENFELKKLEEENRLKAEELRLRELEQKKLIDQEVAKVRAEVEAEVELRSLKRKDPPDQTLNSVGSLKTQEQNLNQLDKDGRPLKTSKTEETKQEDEDEETAWQRQIAEEMALEAAAQDSGTSLQTQQPVISTTTTTINNTSPVVPQGLSIEELRATFKAMLLEKSIDPMAPWDNELPKFVTDSRYLALSSMKERRDLFDEFCKEKIRQQRAAKQSAPKVDPPQAYRSLLVEFVTSTRTLWDEFKSKHKKDPRFRNFGRDDREREKVFKSWLKELGELKRKELTKAEESFKAFLRESSESIKALKDWKEVRDQLRSIDSKKFDLVGSNSAKESMWKKWSGSVSKNGDETKVDLRSDKKSKEENSLRAREEEVRRMRASIEKQTDLTRNRADREEAEREFKLLLVDVVRDHDFRWDEFKSIMERDSRFKSLINNQISKSDLIKIFEAHLDSIYKKRVRVLENFFENLTRSNDESLRGLMDQDASDLMTSDEKSSSEKLVLVSILKRLLNKSIDLKNDLKKDGGGELDEEDRRRMFRVVERHFNDWQSRKEVQAREAFERMLGESSFIEFWGRIKKAEVEKRKAGVEDGMGIKDEEEEEEEEVVDLREMARSIDFEEIESVLKNDSRWIVFSHLKEERELWIRVESFSSSSNSLPHCHSILLLFFF
ncbi:hypothetical protein PPACK8108_LOCUS22415 [Phakopsora pachyrhizi]|uniref:Transcription elongation regulator 1 n=1 Tax=Phakopsora pachyrhizi TaxID=170000 RepID=A0AAV0BMA0_PHAPC|nr:hypothetical protein PPACK8108_LOCUS22415 [Phakopsora pachyrhizi]